MCDKLLNNEVDVLIMCIGYKSRKSMDAITQEARNHFEFFRNKTKLNVQFSSIELEGDTDCDYDKENDVYYCGENIKNLLSQLNPNTIHLFCDSLDGFYLLEQNLSECSANVILTLTGIPSINIYDEGYFVHLQHAIDVGNLTLFVHSSTTKKLLENKGLFCHLILPKIQLERRNFTKKLDDKFTIGFASAPFLIEEWKNRGVYMLLDVASKLPHFNFKLAWRDSDISEINQEVIARKLSNIQILNGNLDMYEFYSDVDAMIAPFTSSENNHSTPFSIIEAIILGIPAIVTSYSGLSDVITNQGFGVVVAPTLNDIVKGIAEIHDNYQSYQRNVLEKGEELFGFEEDKNSYLKVYTDLKNKMISPTLKDWTGMLGNNGLYLVSGISSMQEYYDDVRIATEYDDTRFTEHPMKMFDILEREAIKMHINSFGSIQNDSKLLDIASGDGRILRELANYGDVTAVENSLFMISVSAKKMKSRNRVTYVNDNFFAFDSDSQFDVVTAFRFIRHFNYCDRKKIYEKIHRLLSDDGIFIADFPDKTMESQLRHNDWHKFNIYDVFWTEQDIVEELADNDFSLLHSIDIGEYLLASDKVKNIELPLSRVVAFKKV